MMWWILQCHLCGRTLIAISSILAKIALILGFRQSRENLVQTRQVYVDNTRVPPVSPYPGHQSPDQFSTLSKPAAVCSTLPGSAAKNRPLPIPFCPGHPPWLRVVRAGRHLLNLLQAGHHLLKFVCVGPRLFTQVNRRLFSDNYGTKCWWLMGCQQLSTC